MNQRCIVIPAIKKNAVIPDQLIKKLAGVTLMERALNTARSVLPGRDIIVLTDSQEISLISERAGVGYRCDSALRFTGPDIVAQMRGLLTELAAKYEHCLILRASCPLLTWVDVENAWKHYLESGADSLVTVRSVSQRIFSERGGTLASLLDLALAESQDDAVSGSGTSGPAVAGTADRTGSGSGHARYVVESRALIILSLQKLAAGSANGRLNAGMSGRTIPWFLDEQAIEIQNYQDWWICERLLLRRHVVFVVAGYPAIGMGHVFRALMLAGEISEHRVTFVCTRESELAVESIAARDYKIVRQGGESLAGTVLAQQPDLVINDFLNTDPDYMQSLVAAGCKIVNFEDDGPGAEQADLVVNALYENARSTERLCCGAGFFCLRDEFLGAARNPLRTAVATLLITFGGTDSQDCSRRILDIVEPICRAWKIAIRLVAGPGYAHRQRMEEHVRALANPLLEFTWATNVMSRMMEGADLAICSAGRTVYELAHMRVPGIVLAHHEREARHSFARHRNGFAFLGIMDQVTDSKIRNVFLAMCKQERRARYWQRQNSLDFTRNKARVVRLMLDLVANLPDA